MKRQTVRRLALLAAAVWLAAWLAATLAGAGVQPAADYAQKVDAAQRMAAWEEAIRGYKQELAIPLSDEDFHQTGLIGEVYTGITTTAGAVEAKRTAALPDMAALMVHMLDQAGLEEGDAVGTGMSGSFPGLDLAVLAACEAMGLRCVYIPSVGASTYGANQPQLTFPDMVFRLYQDGLLSTPPALVTLGGQDDCGLDMDPALREEIASRIQSYGLPLLREEDFEQNIAARMELYQQQGPIQCFVGVGGNLTTSGLGETDVGWGLIQPGSLSAAKAGSGLLQRYSAQGLPTIHLLNVKRLVADYGLAYDPQTPPALGTSAIYQTTAYPRWTALVGLAGGAAILLAGFRPKREVGP